MKEESPLNEELDWSKPNFQFRPSEQHTWRQQGPYIICRSCDLEHAIFIGIEKILVGIDNTGNPIIKLKKTIGIEI